MPSQWPALDYEAWSATCDTLHAHTQVLGKLAAAAEANGVEDLVMLTKAEVGELEPDLVHVPSVYVKRIFQGKNYQKWIEKRTVRAG